MSGCQAEMPPRGRISERAAARRSSLRATPASISFVVGPSMSASTRNSEQHCWEVRTRAPVISGYHDSIWRVGRPLLHDRGCASPAVKLNAGTRYSRHGRNDSPTGTHDRIDPHDAFLEVSPRTRLTWSAHCW
jgi:hypothetical protein